MENRRVIIFEEKQLTMQANIAIFACMISIDIVSMHNDNSKPGSHYPIADLSKSEQVSDVRTTY